MNGRGFLVEPASGILLEQLCDGLRERPARIAPRVALAVVCKPFVTLARCARTPWVCLAKFLYSVYNRVHGPALFWVITGEGC